MVLKRIAALTLALALAKAASPVRAEEEVALPAAFGAEEVVVELEEDALEPSIDGAEALWLDPAAAELDPGALDGDLALEVDLAGCVNSTHVNGVKIMNGIGGSGDYSRNAGLSIFSTQSTAKNGTVSCIVPTVSHVDHTDHDTMIIVTEQGVADLRYKDAFERAELMIENCAHPKFRPALRRYLEDAMRDQNKHFLPPMPNMKLEASET